MACESPSTKDGKTFACRRCNSCVASRRFDWVARAMAEKSQHPHTFAITLTYGDETQSQRDGAMMFRYRDIQLLMKSLRRHIQYTLGLQGAFRYLCAGEQGDRKQRCHWHLVIFSQVDLATVGEYLAPWGVVTKREHIVSRVGKPKRCMWSFWPHGMVVVQEPDEQGLSYALSYALKDQFSTASSKGTFREAKSENLATGFFRMSKAPPIGLPYAEQYLERLREKNSILPSLQLPIPDSKLVWYPRGAIRQWMLHTLRRINEEIGQATGQNAPQWSTLIHNHKDSPNDMEILLDGEEDENEESVESLIRKRAAQQAEDYRRGGVLRRCGSTEACNACLRSATRASLENRGIESYASLDGKILFRYKGETSGEKFRKAQRDASRGRANPLCGLKNTDYVTEYLRPSTERD